MPSRNGGAVEVRIEGAETRISPPLYGAVAPVDALLARRWTAGNGTGQVDVVHAVAYDIDDTPTVVDLGELASMVGGSAAAVVRCNLLVVENTGSTAMTIGGGSTPLLPNAVPVQPGGLVAIAFGAGGADGVDTSTNDLLSIATAASTTTARVTILGRTAAA